MSEANLNAEHAVMTAQIQIIRAGTGKVENYTITGTVPNDTMQVVVLPEPAQEDPSNTL